MILTVTPNPALDKFYWLKALPEDLGLTEEGSSVRAEKSITSAGGKGINVSVFLAAHGIDTVAMGFLGGHTGQIILRDLLSRGVSTNFVWIEEENRVNVVLIVRGKGYHPIHIHEAGPRITSEDLRIFWRKYKRMLSRATYVVLGGALPPGLSPNFYRELAQAARERGVPVILHAGGEPMLRAVEQGPFLVKPDVREVAYFGDLPLHTEEEVIVAGRRALGLGAGACLISHHLTGDFLICSEGIWKFEAKVSPDVVRNVIGADDALVGGTLVGLSQGKDLVEAVKYGMAAAEASAEVDEKFCLELEKIAEKMDQIEVEYRGKP